MNISSDSMQEISCTGSALNTTGGYFMKIIAHGFT